MFITDALNYYSGDYLFREKGYASGETLIKEMSQYSPCKALIEEAQNVTKELGLSALEVRFESTISGFDAETDKNVIRIKPSLKPADQRHLFVFELTNVIQYKTHMETWNLAVKGVYTNAEEFARAAEYIEFCGLKRSNAVCKAINKQNGRFFRSYIQNRHEWMSKRMVFDYYYNSYLQDSHKKYYRKAWKRLGVRPARLEEIGGHACKIASLRPDWAGLGVRPARMQV